MAGNQRKVVEGNLALSAPRLSPTVQQAGGLGGGGYYPKQRGSLTQLGQALEQMGESVGSILLQRSNELDNKAETLGELKASELGASAKMEEINAALKTLVDEGKISRSRLPKAQIGSERRYAAGVAESGVSMLYSKFQDVTKVLNPEDLDTVINETRAELLNKVPASVEAQEAFDNEFTRISKAFRTESVLASQKAHEAFQDDTRRESLDDRLTAITSQLPGSSEQAQAVLQLSDLVGNAYKNEMAPQDVAAMVAKDASAFIKDMVSQGDQENARLAFDAISSIDLTGKGGLLGETSAAREVLAPLRGLIERMPENDFDDTGKQMKKAQDAAEYQMRKDIGGLLADGRGLDASTAQELISAYQEANPSDYVGLSYYKEAIEDAAARSQARASGLSSTREVQAIVSGFNRQLRQFNFDEADQMLKDLTGVLEPEQLWKMQASLEDSKQFVGIYNSGFEVQAVEAVFGTDPDAIPRFPSADVSDKYYGLSNTEKVRIQNEARHWYAQQYKDAIINTGDAEAAKSERHAIYTDLLPKLQEHAEGLTRAALRKKGNQAFNFDVETAVKAGTSAQSVAQTARRFALSEEARNSGKAAVAELGKLAKETSEVLIPGGVDITKVFAALAANKKQKQAREAYFNLKAVQGFTPKELKDGKTSEGIYFDAAEVDGMRHPVFESLEQLEKAWNNQEPTEEFKAVAEKSLRGQNKFPHEFYQAQKVLLKERDHTMSQYLREINIAQKN